MNQTAAIFIISFLILGLIVAIPHHVTEAKSAKDSKARRDIDKAVGRAVEGKFSSIKTVNISTYTAPNESITVYNKTSSGSVIPRPPIPPEPQVCNKNDHLDTTTGACVPDTPVTGYKVCMVGDFKDKKVFDAMTSCNFKVALGDNGYGSDLKLLKSIAPDRCVIGNHDDTENSNANVQKEALAYCGDSWWVKFGSSTLMLGFNTQGDLEKQLNAAKGLLQDTGFMSGVKNVIAVSHKAGHTFPNAHHPAEAKDFFATLEGNIPDGVKLLEVSGHNHNAAAAPAKGWYISGNGGKGFYSCGQDKDWTFCNNKAIAYLEATIPDNSNNNSTTISLHFIDTSGKSIM